MKLALLGTDPDILNLAAAARALGHEITWVGDVRPADEAAIAELASDSTDRADQWESVLDRANTAAVLVGVGQATTELRAEQLKRLAAEAIPLLIVHPICDTVLPYYELDMTRRETGGIVRHYNPMACHPAATELARWVHDVHPSIGAIHQVSCERRLDDDSRQSALAHLARDMELVAMVVGDIRRVTAIGPRTAEASFASLQVQMSAAGPASVSWSVRSSQAAAARFEMTLIGERGSTTLRADEDSTANGQMKWEIDTLSGDQQDREALVQHDSAASAIQQLADAIQTSNVERHSTDSTWEAATRAMEVVDAVELSLEKGRTIDVVQQQLTERLAFRGTMAAMGCGLLLLSFFAVVFVTILGGAEGAVGRRLIPAWPLVVLAVLAFFLVLQVVPLLVHKSQRSKSRRGDQLRDDGL